MKVFVTGGTGFVGRSVVERLARDGWTVVAGGRSRPRGSTTAGVVTVGVDITDRMAVREAVRGCAAAVHLAGIAHTRGVTMKEYERVNVEGARTVAEESGRAGVRRFVLMSTAKVHGACSEEPFTEQDAPSPPDPYSTSKLLAEEATAQVSSESGMQLAILRPPLISGPGVKANLLAMVKALARGWPIPVSKSNRRSVLNVNNAADAVAYCVAPAGPVGTFLVTDETDLSTHAMAHALCAGLRVDCRAFTLPSMLSRLTRTVTPHAFDRLLGSFALDASHFFAAGWKPVTTAWDGLADTGRWYRDVSGRS
jgi:nucleoside-diphosphate-sugar epimerase